MVGETKVEKRTNKLLLSEIVPNKYQPRKNFDEENLNDLTIFINNHTTKFLIENLLASLLLIFLVGWQL